MKRAHSFGATILLLLGICLTLIPALVYSQSLTSQSLTLKECTDRALSNHPLLRAAQARVQAAEESRRYAAVRPNPTVTLQTENWRAWQRPSFAPGTDLDLFLYGSQRFETAGKAARRRELADQHVATAQSEIEVVRRQLRQNITQRFWTALQAQILLGIIAENRGDLDQLVEYTSIRVREGYVAEGELIRARLEQQKLLSEESSVAQSLERAKLDLLKAMGETNFETNFRLAESAVTNSPLLAMPLEQLRNEAIATRPELIALRARVAAERANLRLQQAHARPDYEVSAGYKRTGGFNAFLVYLTIPLPFFNKNLGEIGRVLATITSAEQELLAEENYIRAEVETAWRNVQKLSARLNDLQRDFLKQADDARNVALVAYREGAADLYKLLEAQRARNEARLLYFRTVQEFQFSLAELALAAGREAQ